MAKKKAAPRRIKYYKIEFKVTESQRKEMRQYCSRYGTTPKRMFRRAVVELMQRGFIKHSTGAAHISENQMSIFDIVEDPMAKKN
jgi:hypothetical protein